MYYPNVKIPSSIQFAIKSEIHIPPLGTLPKEPIAPKKEDNALSLIVGKGCLLYIIFIIIFWIIQITIKISHKSLLSITTFATIPGFILMFFSIFIPSAKQEEQKYQENIYKYFKEMEIFEQQKETYNLTLRIINNKETYLKEQRLIKVRGSFFSQRINSGYVNNTQGHSEDYFFQFLNAKFGDNILRNRSVGIFKNSIGYIPDFIYFDEKNGLKIDIEIDEPYDVINKTPIHYLIGDKITSDSSRDNFFLESGWIVVRFSEEQVMKYPTNCCNLIEYIVNAITCDNPFIPDTKFYPQMKMWTLEEAQIMASQNYRNSYGVKIWKQMQIIKPEENTLYSPVPVPSIENVRQFVTTNESNYSSSLMSESIVAKFGINETGEDGLRALFAKTSNSQFICTIKSVKLVDIRNVPNISKTKLAELKSDEKKYGIKYTLSVCCVIEEEPSVHFNLNRTVLLGKCEQAIFDKTGFALGSTAILKIHEYEINGRYVLGLA